MASDGPHLCWKFCLEFSGPVVWREKTVMEEAVGLVMVVQVDTPTNMSIGGFRGRGRRTCPSTPHSAPVVDYRNVLSAFG